MIRKIVKKFVNRINFFKEKISVFVSLGTIKVNMDVKNVSSFVLNVRMEIRANNVKVFFNSLRIIVFVLKNLNMIKMLKNVFGNNFKLYKFQVV
jgi:hypothetical protein